MLLFLHGPLNVMDVSKNLPLGTLMVDRVKELHADIHAFRNDWVESVFPSGFAPNVITL
uniref:Uncharacterized protein n=1 Tax=Cucumis sativus TaxID=3659 RepID=A0A0A0KW96_CUCSA